jgi:hypothetical protein
MFASAVWWLGPDSASPLAVEVPTDVLAGPCDVDLVGQRLLGVPHMDFRSVGRLRMTG